MAVLDTPLSGHPTSWVMVLQSGMLDGSATQDDMAESLSNGRIYKPVDVHMMWGCRPTPNDFLFR
jgi:hypothetical protein